MIVAAFVQCIRSVPVVVRAGGNDVSVVNRSQFRASEEFYSPQLLKSYRKKVLRFNHIKCKPPLKPICKLNETTDFLKLIVYISLATALNPVNLLLWHLQATNTLV